MKNAYFPGVRYSYALLTLLCWCWAGLAAHSQSAPTGLPTYCTPGNFSGCGSAPITRVQLTGTTLNNPSSCQNNGFGNAFTDYPATGAATGTVQQGVTYAFGVTSSSSNATVRAWVDWNQNGTFESTEVTYVTSGGSGGVPSVVGLTIPTTALLGPTKLRVRTRASSGTITSTDACTALTSGETEDYTITVAAAPVPAPAYCTPGNFITGCGSASITRVQLTGTTLNNVSTCQLDNFGNAYTIFAPSGAATGTVQRTVTYAFGVTSANSNATVRAWADWNQNGTFESTEVTYVTDGGSGGVPSVVGLTIPATALLGPTKLRIRTRASSGTITSTDACTDLTSGETEDYTITVADAPTPAPLYCTPGNFISGCGSASITRVQLTGTTLNNASTCQLDNFGNAYVTFPATGAATGTVQQGVTYAFGVTSSSSSATVRAWADWNQNGTFESTEVIYVTDGGSGGVPSITGLTIPATALLGPTRLRIRTRASSATINNTDACTAFGSGETEDYIITVADAPVPAPAYCTPGNFISGCGNSQITRVQLTGTTLNNVSTCQLDGFGNAYTTFAPTGAATGTVQRTVTYAFGVTSNNGNATVRAWADWNQNNTFDSNEVIFVTDGSSSGVPSIVGLTIPATALLGPTRLRVRTRASSATISNTDACTGFGSGETEDYTITVADAPNPAPPYCTPGNFIIGCGNGQITRVEVVGSGLNNASTCQLDNFGNAYAEVAPAGTATGTVQQGLRYALRVTTDQSAIISAWADWNQNNVFESGEWVQVATTSSANVAAIVSLNVPTNATLGSVRLRIRSRASGSSNGSTDPCTAFGSGETEDYTITVGAAPNPAPLYCIPGNFTVGCGNGQITRVEVVGSGLNNASTCQLDGFGNAYAQYPAGGTGAPVATVQPGTTYALRVTTDQSAIISGWADWNQNGAFESGEWVQVATSSSPNVAASVALAVPAGANLGRTWLRVRSRASGSSNGSTSACADFGSGETEDYLLSVGTCALAAPTISAGSSVCAGTTIQLTATGVPAGATYQWSGPNSFSSALPSPQIPNAQAVNSGTYLLTITSGACSVTSAGLNVVVSPLPSVSISNSRSPSLCQGESVTLTANGASSYLWSTGATTASITVSAAGTYSVTGTSAAGCRATSAGTTVTVSPRPTAGITAGGPTTFCAGGSVTLTASGGISYVWSTGATTTSITVTTGGPYSVTATNAGSCSATASPVTVTVNPVPSAAFTYPAATFCRGGAPALPTITGATGGTFSATPAGLSLNAQTGQLNPATSTPGTYTVTYALTGTCPAQQVRTVAITAAPAATFSYAGGPWCVGSAASISPALGTGSTAGTFSASPAGLVINATNGQIAPGASQPGLYTVTNTVAASGGCAAATATTTVQVSARPTPTITASGPTTLCQGGSVTLTASGGTSYLWSTGATTASISVSSPGPYSVTATNGVAGCSGTSSPVTISVAPTPSAAFAYASSTFCRTGANPTPTITGAAGGTFSATPAGLGLNPQTGQLNLAASATGTYTVTYAVAGPCPAQAVQVLTISTAPAATFSYPAGTLCAGSFGTATPTFAAGASAGTFSASPAGLNLSPTTGAVIAATSLPGTYTVTNTIAAGGGCAAATATTTLVIGSGSALFAYSAPAYCQTNASPTPTVSGTPGGTFSATPAGLAINATTGQINLGTSQAGTYSVAYTLGPPCPARLVQTVTITAPPLATFSYPAATRCAGSAGTVTPALGAGATAGTFTALPTGLSLDPTTGAITLVASAPGTYTVINTVAGSGTCSDVAATATITLAAPPSTAFAYAGSTFCLSGANPVPTVSGAAGGTFSATPAGLAINATTGQLNLTASTAGTYTVTYAIGGTCPSSTSQAVTLSTAPAATFSYPAGTPCAGSVGTVAPSFGAGASAGVFSATPAGLALNPVSGVIDAGASAAGTYTVTNAISAGGGCAAASATAILTLAPTPAVPTITVQPIGAGLVQLTSSAPTGNQWLHNGQPIPGATGPTYVVSTGTQSGLYTVVVSAGPCQAVSAPLPVTVTAAPATLTAASLHLFPNPTAGFATLELPAQAQALPLVLLDATGRQVLAATLPAGSTTHLLDLRTLPSGVYAVRVGTTVRRLVRE